MLSKLITLLSLFTCLLSFNLYSAMAPISDQKLQFRIATGCEPTECDDSPYSHKIQPILIMVGSDHALSTFQHVNDANPYNIKLHSYPSPSHSDIDWEMYDAAYRGTLNTNVSIAKEQGISVEVIDQHEQMSLYMLTRKLKSIISYDMNPRFVEIKEDSKLKDCLLPERNKLNPFPFPSQRALLNGYHFISIYGQILDINIKKLEKSDISEVAIHHYKTTMLHHLNTITTAYERQLL